MTCIRLDCWSLDPFKPFFILCTGDTFQSVLFDQFVLFLTSDVQYLCLGILTSAVKLAWFGSLILTGLYSRELNWFCPADSIELSSLRKSSFDFAKFISLVHAIRLFFEASFCDFNVCCLDVDVLTLSVTPTELRPRINAVSLFWYFLFLFVSSIFRSRFASSRSVISSTLQFVIWISNDLLI